MLFTILGVLLIIAAIASTVLIFTVVKEDTPYVQHGQSYVEPASHPFFVKMGTKKFAIIFGVLAIMSFAVNGAFFIADGSEQYAVQYVWGQKVAVREPGLKAKFWGKVIPISNEIVVKYVIPSNEGQLPENSEYTRVIIAQEWEFNDAVKGSVAATVVVNTKQMVDADFLELAFNVRSQKNFELSRIVPAMNAALKTSAKLMGAQDYMSGKASDFDYYFKDQLINGPYRLKEIANHTGDESIILDSVRTKSGANKLEESTQPKSKSYVVLENANGDPIRQVSETVFTKYKIAVIQATAEDVDWEQKFDIRLDKQKDLVAEIQEKKRGAEKEYFARLEEEQKGEREKVTEQKKLEKEQIQLTIAAETKVLTSSKLIEEEKNKLAAERLASQRLRVQKDAEAYANKKLVTAGLTPQERANIDKEIAIGVAKELAKLDLPSTVIIGAGNGSTGDGLLATLLGAKIAESMLGPEKKKE
jgi:hypothetical protein